MHIGTKCEASCPKCSSKIKLVRITKDLTGYNSIQVYCTEAIKQAYIEGYIVKPIEMEVKTKIEAIDPLFVENALVA